MARPGGVPRPRRPARAGVPLRRRGRPRRDQRRARPSRPGSPSGWRRASCATSARSRPPPTCSVRRSTCPWAIAPMTLQRAADPDGEVAMARAAAAAGVPLVVSSNSGRTFEDIAATGVAWWLQIYMPPDGRTPLPLLQAAVGAGAAAVVLTADTPVVGTRYPLPEGPHVWEMADPSWLNANVVGHQRAGAGGPRQGDGPGPGRRGLAGREPPDCPWWSRGSFAPTTPGAAPTPGRARCGSPTTADASSTRRWRPRAAWPRCARPCPTGSRCTSTGECARDCT